jgi:hypothetical protein
VQCSAVQQHGDPSPGPGKLKNRLPPACQTEEGCKLGGK